MTEGKVEGGEMQYSLSEEDPYSAAIPVGTEVDTYTIWYKIVGDNNP